MPLNITQTTPVDGYTVDRVQRLDYTSTLDNAADWALLRHSDKPNGTTWVVHVHGHGSSGDQLFTRPDIRDIWLPRYMDRGFSLLSPNLRGNAWMGPAAVHDLNALLLEVTRRYSAQRFLLLSGSMGGTSNLIFAALHPQLVAGVVALCPATDVLTYRNWCKTNPNPPVLEAIRLAIDAGYERNDAAMTAHSALRASARLTMPVYVCHGSADAIIPVSESRALASKMADVPHFRYDEIHDGNHDAPLAKMPEALDWLTAQLDIAG